MIHQFSSRDKRAMQQSPTKTPALSEMLPNSLDAEQNVLGLLLNGAPIHLVSDLVHADDFWKDEHRIIYQAMLLLAEQRQPIEVIMISENLRSQNIIIEDEVGGYLYLSKLSRQAYEQIQGHSALENHAQMIADKALARRGLAACQELAQVFYRENAQVALSLAQTRFAELFTANSYADFLPINEFADETIEQITDLQDRGGGLVGIPCGFHGLDAMTNGLLKAGKLIIFGGRTGHGKTSWVLSVIHHIASKEGARVGILSLEMSKSELFKRQISLDARIDSLRMSSGRMTPDEYARFRASAERLRTYPIFIDDTFGCDISDLEAKAYRLHAKHGLDVLVVDYLQLLDAEQQKEQGEVARLTAISRGLKGLARRLNIPVIALVQVNRTVESKASHIPTLADIRGSGCLAGDSLIFLPDQGIYQRIDSLIGKKGVRVLALNEETWKLESSNVINAFSTGCKPIYKLVTRLGRTIRATGNHKFLSFDGWKRLDEIALEDRIALPRTLPNPQLGTMTQAELALLGHLVGDGCTLPRHSIQYTTVDYDLAELVMNLASQVFRDSIAPRIQRDEPKGKRGGWYQVFFPATYPLARGVHNPISQWLRELGAYGFRSYEKFVPEKVFAQPEEGIATFLRHLWSTDGHASCNTNGRYRPNPRAYYATSSNRLAIDVQSLLLRIGINARLRRVSQGAKGRDQYHVVLSGKPDLERFISIIGIVGERKQRMLEQVRIRIEDRVSNTNRDIIPNMAWRQIVVPAMTIVGMTISQVQIAMGGTRSGTTTLYKNHIGRERAARIAAIVQCTHLSRLAQSDVYWDEVVSIELDGEEEVYDLTVDKHHNFVANNIIVHNSIEQDADMVLFLYRDEMYNENTERKGQADIIVAKHREGPQGTDVLGFESSCTRFYNLCPEEEAEQYGH